ncbi:MAG: aminoglycoside phosphotransferase, partial [Oscillospiraceae bacterium]|nr:aminoglycoside phosphotransferase [Oscillospiraceae bacterium]
MVIIAERPRKTVYRDGDRCIKTFDESFSKADILNEALNQARVEETGLNIPRLRGVTTIDGRWAIEYDFIEGKTLAQLMEENPDKLDEYLNDFIDLQLKMHAERCPSLGKLKDKMARKLKEADLDD